MSKDHEPPSGKSSGEGPPPEHSETEQPPPYNPDPDLITFLEREAKPGEVKVWDPRGEGKPERL
jgi:hypothetical protein